MQTTKETEVRQFASESWNSSVLDVLFLKIRQSISLSNGVMTMVYKAASVFRHARKIKRRNAVIRAQQCACDGKVKVADSV
jgi:hypothetical protein